MINNMNLKKENKFLALSILSILFISIIAGFASAANANSLTGLAQGFIGGIVEVLNPILGWMLGAERTNENGFIIKLFFAVIMFSVVYVVLNASLPETFKERKWAIVVISVALPVIGLRFMTADWLNTLLLPQQTFVASVIILIPFALFFYLTKDWNPAARRAGWVSFGVVFLMIWTTVTDLTVSADDTGAKNIYPIAAFACFLMALFDGTISRWWNNLRDAKMQNDSSHSARVTIMDKLNEVDLKYRESIQAGTTYHGRVSGGGLGHSGQTAYDKDRSALMNRLKQIK